MTRGLSWVDILARRRSRHLAGIHRIVRTSSPDLPSVPPRPGNKGFLAIPVMASSAKFRLFPAHNVDSGGG
jgi:hypothetical protein